MSQLPARLSTFVEDFGYCQGQEKLEYLLELAQELRPLPSWLQGKRDQMIQIKECMSPVFVHLENQNGRLTFHFDIPEEAPTVRGYAAVLQQGLVNATSADLQALPEDLYAKLGLEAVLSQQRLNGIHALTTQLKALAQQVINER